MGYETIRVYFYAVFCGLVRHSVNGIMASLFSANSFPLTYAYNLIINV